jgi:organic radical activating enzyme
MNDFYCAAPWRGLHINPRGDVKTCCAGDPNMLGNLNEHSIEQILHGPVMQQIRQTLRQGRPHDRYCYNCVQAERYGRSERDWHNNVNPDFDSSQARDLEHCPVLIDLRWNTTCNLSCNYCGDKCSSKWAALKGTAVKSGAKPYLDQVCEYLRQHQHHIKEVALVGGEPLLLPENERILDVVPADCTITLITNLSVDFQRNAIVAKLLQRDRVGWSMSFDNIGPRFEYVRHGASWALLQTNLSRVQAQFGRGHWGGVHAVYNMYNATRLEEFVAWAKSQALETHWQSLYQPACLDPLKHQPAIRDLAQQQLAMVLARSDLTVSERRFFLQAQANFLTAPDSDMSLELKNHIQEIESQYHTDQTGKFHELWPEISMLL